MRYKYFHYMDNYGVIRIKAKRKPSINTRNQSGTWVAEEFNDGKWILPCFPQITLGTLNKLIYLGNIPLEG